MAVVDLADYIVVDAGAFRLAFLIYFFVFSFVFGHRSYFRGCKEARGFRLA